MGMLAYSEGELKKLDAVLKQKAKEPAGGKFFKVIGKVSTYTDWARSKEAMEKRLNNKREHFMSVIELI